MIDDLLAGEMSLASLDGLQGIGGSGVSLGLPQLISPDGDGDLVGMGDSTMTLMGNPN